MISQVHELKEHHKYEFIKILTIILRVCRNHKRSKASSPQNNYDATQSNGHHPIVVGICKAKHVLPAMSVCLQNSRMFYTFVKLKIGGNGEVYFIQLPIAHISCDVGLETVTRCAHVTPLRIGIASHPHYLLAFNL